MRFFHAYQTKPAAGTGWLMLDLERPCTVHRWKVLHAGGGLLAAGGGVWWISAARRKKRQSDPT